MLTVHLVVSTSITTLMVVMVTSSIPAMRPAASTMKPIRRKGFKCEYTLVVKEADSSSCPKIHQHQNSQVHGQPWKDLSEERSQTTIADFQRSLLELNSRLMELETKIEQSSRTSQELSNAGRQQETKYVNLDSRMSDMEDQLHELNSTLSENLTQVTEALQGIDSQTSYWKSVDRKLGGLMLDMTEMGNVLLKQNNVLDILYVKDKIIPVIPTSQAQSCETHTNVTKYRDCDEVFQKGETKSGVYYITPLYASCPIPVFCDMDTPPGGWVVLQRRSDGSENFNRSWSEYRSGFGSVGQEFWLGLDTIFLLTNQRKYELRVDLWDFSGSRVQATYRKFFLDGEKDGYRLHVSNHTGTVNDGLRHHDGMRFSAPNRDHDTYPGYHCALEWGAGWWFSNCWFVILNGPYYNQSDVRYKGICWNEWKGEQLKQVEMKIRPSTMEDEDGQVVEPPEVEEVTHKPEVEKVTSKPEIEEYTVEPEVEEFTAETEVEKQTVKPEVGEFTVESEVENHTVKSGEHVIIDQEVEEYTAQPEVEYPTTRSEFEEHTVVESDVEIIPVESVVDERTNGREVEEFTETSEVGERNFKSEVGDVIGRSDMEKPKSVSLKVNVRSKVKVDAAIETEKSAVFLENPELTVAPDIDMVTTKSKDKRRVTKSEVDKQNSKPGKGKGRSRKGASNHTWKTDSPNT